MPPRRGKRLERERGSPPVALLVEDDAPVRDLTARVLEFRGFTVIQAANGLEALRHLEDASDIAVIVTDLLMPAMDGYQLLEAVRDSRRLPAVAITATLALTEEQEKRLGGAPLLYKPFTMESLIAAVRAAQFHQSGCSYHVDEPHGVVTIRTTAVPSLEETIATVNRIWGDPRYRRGFTYLVDRRGHEVPPTTENLRAFVRYLGDHERRLSQASRWGVVADRPSLWRFYQSLEANATAAGVEMRAFQDYDDAFRWASRSES